MGSIPIGDSGFSFLPRSRQIVISSLSFIYRAQNPPLSLFIIQVMLLTSLNLAVCRTRVTVNVEKWPRSPRVSLRALKRYLGDHGFDSHRGLRIFLCPTRATNGHFILYLIFSSKEEGNNLHRFLFCKFWSQLYHILNHYLMVL